jgi:hypothetical protein
LPSLSEGVTTHEAKSNKAEGPTSGQIQGFDLCAKGCYFVFHEIRLLLCLLSAYLSTSLPNILKH